MRQIGRDDTIFSSPAFLWDSVLFNLYALMRESSSPILFSDSESAIVAQAAPGMPMWIWTADGISAGACRELLPAVRKSLIRFPASNITAKPAMYKLLILERTGPQIAPQHLIAYGCDRPVLHDVLFGSFYRPCEKDVPRVAEFLAEYEAESSAAPGSMRDLLAVAEQMIYCKELYLWKNPRGEVVSMAKIAHRGMGQARIHAVFTKPDQRNKGYAGMLVYTLCGMIRKEQLLPMLYADAENAAANKTYQKIGFANCGDLMILSLSGRK